MEKRVRKSGEVKITFSKLSKSTTIKAFDQKKHDKYLYSLRDILNGSNRVVVLSPNPDEIGDESTKDRGVIIKLAQNN